MLNRVFSYTAFSSELTCKMWIGAAIYMFIRQRRLAFGLNYEHLSPMALYLDEAYLQESSRMLEAIEVQQGYVLQEPVADDQSRIGTVLHPRDVSPRVLKAVSCEMLHRLHHRISTTASTCKQLARITGRC